MNMTPSSQEDFLNLAAAHTSPGSNCNAAWRGMGCGQTSKMFQIIQSAFFNVSSPGSNCNAAGSGVGCGQTSKMFQIIQSAFFNVSTMAVVLSIF